MIVVDANVIVYAVVESDRTALAKKIASKDAEWLIPTLWRYEVTGALTTLVRGRALDLNRALDAMQEADQLSAHREIFVSQQSVIRTALLFNLSAYDAQYVALAQHYQTRCVTADQRMIANAPQLAISLEQAIQEIG